MGRFPLVKQITILPMLWQLNCGGMCNIVKYLDHCSSLFYFLNYVRAIYSSVFTRSGLWAHQTFAKRPLLFRPHMIGMLSMKGPQKMCFYLNTRDSHIYLRITVMMDLDWHQISSGNCLMMGVASHYSGYIIVFVQHIAWVHKKIFPPSSALAVVPSREIHDMLIPGDAFMRRWNEFPQMLGNVISFICPCYPDPKFTDWSVYWYPVTHKCVNEVGHHWFR